jgi:hypothetical protein
MTAGPLNGTPSQTSLRWLAWVVVGTAVALIAWVLLVPWDLSEVDTHGRELKGRGDDNAPFIAVVALVVLVGGVLLSLSDRTRHRAAAAVAGGSLAWVALFVWRAGVAEVSGANLFLVPLVMFVIPVGIAMPLIVRGLAGRIGRTST